MPQIPFFLTPLKGLSLQLSLLYPASFYVSAFVGGHAGSFGRRHSSRFCMVALVIETISARPNPPPCGTAAPEGTRLERQRRMRAVRTVRTA